jgi:hypothetical protein
VRVSLLKKIKLADDWRAHVWLLSHSWPEQFPESRILIKGAALCRAKFDGNNFRVAWV